MLARITAPTKNAYVANHVGRPAPSSSRPQCAWRPSSTRLWAVERDDGPHSAEADDPRAPLLTFFRFPKTQWKTLRTTNTIERLHEEFRRRVKTQGSLPTEDAALVLLFSLVASGQIKLRKIDGWQKIGAVLNQHTAVAA